MAVNLFIIGVLVPSIVIIVFSLIKKENYKQKKKMTDTSFTVALPIVVRDIGIFSISVYLIMIMGFTIFSERKPIMIMYTIVAVAIYLGIYLILKTVKWKLVVEDNQITVYPIFLKKYTFAFEDIIYARRQVRGNRIGSERIVIKTKNKRVIIESSEINYDRLRKRINNEINKEYLIGFDKDMK